MGQRVWEIDDGEREGGQEREGEIERGGVIGREEGV
jgi:hypothetical protein